MPILNRNIIDQALALIARYQRVEVEGLENLPPRGPAILLPNHSGFLGFDALLLSHVIRRHRNRVPRILLHRAWFRGGLLESAANRLGFLEANYKNGLEALERNKFVMMFPEAEEGNFKPINEKYKLREFRKGFVKMAARTGAPVIPVLVIGAEETHINLGQVKIFNQLLPLPLNYFPLPAKWKIRFLPPLQFAAGAETSHAEVKAAGVRREMQAELRKELKSRRYIYREGIL
jgi:1-acyl-sn-glycerol-3-phosphate acyltransferase